LFTYFGEPSIDGFQGRVNEIKISLKNAAASQNPASGVGWKQPQAGFLVSIESGFVVLSLS